MIKYLLVIFIFFVTSGGRAQDQPFSENVQPDSSTAPTASPTVTPSGESETISSRYPDPNKIPYRTRKNALVHFFSIPAKIWRLFWTPLGATIIWVEQNRVQEKVVNFFYLNNEKTAALFPLVSLGGNTGAGAGLMAFHNNLFNKGKKLSASFLYSGTSNNTASIVYIDSTLFGSSFYFDMTGAYFNDSDENFYISDSVALDKLFDSSVGANNSSIDNETSYETEEVGVRVNLGYAFTDKVGLGLVSSFRRADIDSGRTEREEGEKFPGLVPGAGTTRLFSIGGALTFNFTRGLPRVLSGPLLRLSYTYNREINGSRFEFNRFTAEAQQFIPIPFLAKNRRLAIRGVFEKIDRIGKKQVPFYELSLLGDAANLRGFDQNRFRGRGLLLFNFEYRYPIWDFWDGVIFVDEGQVYDDLSDLSLDNFHTAVGAGFRFMSPTGFLMRFEIAKSREQWRALFQILPNF